MRALSPAEAVQSLNSKGTNARTSPTNTMRKLIVNRAIGLGLVTLMAAPFVLVVAAILIFGKAAIDAGGVYGAQIAGIARTVNDEIAPRLDDLRQSYQSVADGVQRFEGDIRQTLARLGSVPDLTIERGQLGSTPPIRIVVPNRNYKIASSDLRPDNLHRTGFELAQFGRSNPFSGNPFSSPPSVPNPTATLPSIELSTGSLLNQTLPSQAIPPRSLSLSTEPVRAALRPVSDGFGQAIGVVQRPLSDAIQQTGAVVQPLLALRDDIVAIAGPLRELGQAFVLVAVLLAAAFVVFVITHAIAAVIVAVRRPAESGTAFLVSGPLGYFGFVGNCVRQEAFSRLTNPREEMRAVGGNGPIAHNAAA